MGEIGKEKAFYLMTASCFFAAAASVPFSKMEFPLAAGSFLQYVKSAFSSQGMLFLVPIVSVLTAGASYVRESSGGFLKLYAVRISRAEYIRRKTMQVYAGGFLPFFFAGLLSLTMGFLFLYPLEYKGTIEMKTVWDAVLLLLRICLTGGITAEVSGIFAAAFCNYYMAYGLPFVCFYLLIILKDRYLQDLYVIDPKEWILTENYWGAGGNGIWVFFLVSSVFFCLLHGLLLGYRLREI